MPRHIMWLAEHDFLLVDDIPAAERKHKRSTHCVAVKQRVYTPTSPLGLDAR